MATNIKLPLVEKYRPKDFNDLLFDDFIRDKIKNIIKLNQIPNMIITGEPSTGKTSTIIYLAKKIYQDNYREHVLELNASDDRGIKSVHDTIINFCKRKVFFKEGYAQHKLLILDEADNITPKAQRLINSIMEKYPTTRFAFTCNNSTDIIESIQSRCVIIRFTKPPEHYLNRLKLICLNEKIIYDDESLLYLFDVSQKDIRQAINILELTFTCYNSLSIENINKICDILSKIIFDNLFDGIINKDITGISKIINKFKNEGYYSLDVLLHFIQYIKTKNITEDLRIHKNFRRDYPDTTPEDIRIRLIEILSNYSFIMSKSSNNYLQLTSAIYNCL